VAPRWDGGGKPERKLRVTQQSPCWLVSPASEIQIGTQNRGTILHHIQQMPGLMCSARRTKPSMPRRSAGIQVRADELNSRGAELYLGRDGYTALQHQGKLDCIGIIKRERSENGISSITLRGSIPHRGRVPQVHSQFVRCVNDVLLFTEPCNEHPPGPALLEWRDGGVTSVRLLHEHNQRRARIGTQGSIVSVPDATYESAQPAPTNPDIPAQDSDAAGRPGHVSRLRGEVKGHVRPDIAAPLLEPESLVIFMSREAEF
jgi:hypothetical protein